MPTPSPHIILGIDPSLRGTGYGIIQWQHQRAQVLTFGTIKIPSRLRQSLALVEIREKLSEIIREKQPHSVAIEGVIYLQNYKTAISLGAARAAALIAAAEAGLSIYEYAPRRIKAAATGHGGAQKHQVAFMMRSQLHLTTTPEPDAADALAVALTHAQNTQLLSKTCEL